MREDPKNRNLLYVGTEFGLYISLDGGKKWQKFMNNLPTARVDDILVHPRDNDLIVATHGRSIWIADDITPLQQLAATPPQDPVLFDVRPAVAYLTDRQSGQQVGGQKVFVGENPPRGAALNYYLPSAATGDVKIAIADATGRVVRTLDGTSNAGINRVMWNLTTAPPGSARGGPTSRTRNLRGHAHGKRQVRQQARAGAAGRMAQGEMRRDQGSGIRDQGRDRVRDPWSGIRKTSRPQSKSFPDPDP